jgi:adenylate kinase family enzyme
LKRAWGAIVGPGMGRRTAPKRYAVVLGGPGAGKGTMNERLIGENAKLRHISTGQLLRTYVDVYRESESRSEIVERIEECMGSGKLVEDSVMAACLEEEVRSGLKLDNHFWLQIAIAGLTVFGGAFLALLAALLLGFEPWNTCDDCEPGPQPPYMWPVIVVLLALLMIADLVVLQRAKREYKPQRPPRDDGTVLLLDGYPRTVAQAEAMIKLFGGPPMITLYIDVGSDVAVKRCLSRGRLDDNEAVVKARYEQFLEETMPAVEFLQRCEGRVKRVNGERSVDEVYVDFAAEYRTADERTDKAEVINPMLQDEDDDSDDDSDDDGGSRGGVEKTIADLRELLESLSEDNKEDRRRLEKRIEKLVAQQEEEDEGDD